MWSMIPYDHFSLIVWKAPRGWHLGRDSPHITSIATVFELPALQKLYEIEKSYQYT